MCGRFALHAPKSKIKLQFHLDDLPDGVMGYNIAPGQKVLLVCPLDGTNYTGLWFRWGLIPFWAKDKTISAHLVNARGETIAKKPAFRHALCSKRGVMVMSGFFEWQQDSKQPYYFKNEHGDLLAAAAIWDSWQGTNGEIIHSCCLVTTAANPMMSPIHDRMPVLFTAEEMAIWLDNTSSIPALLDLIKPYTGSDLIGYPVTKKMNSARFTGHEAIEPIRKFLN